MRYVNKKRTRKGWISIRVPFDKWRKVNEWCRRNEYHKTGWYRKHDVFYFQDPAVASEIVLTLL